MQDDGVSDEALERLEAALELVPQRTRAIIEAVYIYREKYRDVARAFEFPSEGACRQFVHAAKRKIRNQKVNYLPPGARSSVQRDHQIEVKHDAS